MTDDYSNDDTSANPFQLELELDDEISFRPTNFPLTNTFSASKSTNGNMQINKGLINIYIILLEF